MDDLRPAHRCAVEERVALANALGDAPETVFAAQLLRRGLCQACVLGEATQYAAAIVEVLPGSLLGFGEDARALWSLLQRVGEWRSLGIASHCASELRAVIERQEGRAVHAETAIFSVLPVPVARVVHPDVRLLDANDDANDVDLLLSGPGGSVGLAYGSPRALLEEGVVAGAVYDGRLVTRAHTSCHSARYADVAIATWEEWQGRGLATAAASMVCERVQQQGRTPIWSTSEDNRASRRIAEKLGFVERSQLTYLSLDPPSERD